MNDYGRPVDGLKLAIRLESLRSEGGALTLMLFSVVFIADNTGHCPPGGIRMNNHAFGLFSGGEGGGQRLTSALP
ncbi:MAG: hypothetical protein JO170_16850 [Verrucomicrobia bacterium]|nr:hypothetical protein [Verrucomicrobiota bacterium]